MLNRDDESDQQNPVTPSLPTCLRRQPAWIDNLEPRPKWKESVKTKPTYLANFDWSKSFWKPFNGSETMNILEWKTPKGAKKVAQLWMIGKIEYATLDVNLFPSYTVKLCLTGNNWQNLRFMLKKWGNLEIDWDPASIELVVNFLIRPDKIQELIELIFNDKEALDVVRMIHFQDTFPFTYNVWESADISSDFLDPGHDVDDFKLGATMAIEFQIFSRNFKVSKKVDAVNAYLFRLLGVYLVDDPIHLTMSIPNKRQHRKDE